MRFRSVFVVLSCAIGACTSSRGDDGARIAYRGDVEPILRAACARCHADPAPAGGFRADTYRGAIGCVASGASASRPAPGGGRAPILAALDRADHVGLVDALQRATLERWVELGAPGTTGGVHDPSFADPRAPGNHGATLRARGYRAMIDPADADACGKCHAGAPTTPPGVALAAPGATPCTTCHTEPSGALACGTCHGSGARPYPPRDPCFFPEEASRGGAHAAHVAPSKAKADGLPCATCHPAPLPGQLAAPHADGYVEVWLDYARAGATARFDAGSGTCTTSCHARGGARPSPSWRAPAQSDCGSCHRTPPEKHYEGACSGCHAELDATGGLVRSALHLNGRLDIGDGSGKCGACHGAGDDPWPRTGAHAAHARPRDARAVPCETCHAVPDGTAPHPRGGGASVRLTGLALVNGARATWNPATRTCASTYCHAGRGAGVPSPRWDEGGAARACGACHASPPPPPHSPSAGCDANGCHTGYAAGAISPARRDAHVDGLVTR